MISKLFLIGGLILVAVSFFVRKILCERVTKRVGEKRVSLSGSDFAAAVLKAGGAKDLEISQKRRPFLSIDTDRLILSPAMAESRGALNVAEAGLRAGLTLMARRQEKVVSWRVWAVKFASVFPVFTLIILAFALVMGRLGGSWVLGIFSGSLGFSCLMLWMTFSIEREAARLVVNFLEEKNLLHRRTESELLGEITKALAWRRIVPGFFRSL